MIKTARLHPRDEKRVSSNHTLTGVRLRMIDGDAGNLEGIVCLNGKTGSQNLIHASTFVVVRDGKVLLDREHPFLYGCLNDVRMTCHLAENLPLARYYDKPLFSNIRSTNSYTASPDDLKTGRMLIPLVDLPCLDKKKGLADFIYGLAASYLPQWISQLVKHPIPESSSRAYGQFISGFTNFPQTLRERAETQGSYYSVRILAFSHRLQEQSDVKGDITLPDWAAGLVEKYFVKANARKTVKQQ
jgi:hypothetical protein